MDMHTTIQHKIPLQPAVTGFTYINFHYAQNNYYNRDSHTMSEEIRKAQHEKQVLSEKCTNMEFFLIHIFLYSD